MRYEVDSDRVAQASSKVAASASAVSTEVNTMLRHLQDLQTVWRGGASTAFSEVLAQWQAAQRQVEDALNSIQGSLNVAANTYANAETEAARLFQAGGSKVRIEPAVTLGDIIQVGISIAATIISALIGWKKGKNGK